MQPLRSLVAQGVSVLAIAGFGLAAPDRFESLVNSLAVGPLRFLRMPEGIETSPYAKLAFFALAYVGTLYVGLGLAGERGFAKYSIYSRLVIYPLLLAACVSLFGVSAFAAGFIFLDAPLAFWCHAELAALEAAEADPVRQFTNYLEGRALAWRKRAEAIERASKKK